MKEEFYRIGELALKSGVTIRTMRYYEELGLLSSNKRTRGGQRTYNNSDFVYIKRIKELQVLGFSLEEIGKIISLKESDDRGESRKTELLLGYKRKKEEAELKIEKLKTYTAELEWHIKQLQEVEDFQSCPGSLCASCEYKKHCHLAIETK